MEHKRLRELLRRLHAELEEEPELDSGTRRLLQEVRADISEALGGPGGAEQTVPHGLRGRLEQTAAAFEASHPQLAGLIGQTLDQLAKLGV
jgi:hypothetical protein